MATAHGDAGVRAGDCEVAKSSAEEWRTRECRSEKARVGDVQGVQEAAQVRSFLSSQRLGGGAEAELVRRQRWTRARARRLLSSATEEGSRRRARLDGLGRCTVHLAPGKTGKLCPFLFFLYLIFCFIFQLCFLFISRYLWAYLLLLATFGA